MKKPANSTTQMQAAQQIKKRGIRRFAAATARALRLNNLSVRMILFHSFIFLLFFILIVAVMYLPFRHAIVAQERADQQRVLEQISASLEANFSNALNFTSVLYYNTPYVEGMIRDYENGVNTLENYFLSISSVSDCIFAIRLCTPEKSYYVYQSTRRYTVVRDNSNSYTYWAEALGGSSGSPRIVNVSSGNIKSSGNSYATIGRMLYDHHGESLGVLLLDVDIQGPFSPYFGSSLNNPYVDRPDTDAYGSFLLTDETGHILLQTDSMHSDFTGGLTAAADTGEFSFEKEHYIVLSQTIARTGWKIYYYLPQTRLLKNLSQLTSNMLLATSAALAVCLTVMVLFARRLSARIHALAENISLFKEGHFDIVAPDKENDEISSLVRGFNEMTQKINSLIREVYVLQIRQKEAAFNALRAQIDPHFINNTLQNIQMLAVLGGQQEISSAIADLGLLLRRNMDVKSDFISIDEELEFIRAYASLMQLRFSSGFDFKIQRDEAVAGRPILRFLLQPVVENAIKHGIAKRITPEARGSVTVRVSVEGRRIVLSVSDNGPGMSEGSQRRLIELFEGGDSADTGDSHIGLQNVNARIRLAYGKKFGVTLRSSPHGTEVMLTVPMLSWDAARALYPSGAESKDPRVFYDE